VPLVNGDPASIELERFDVWAKDAKIVIYESEGKSHTIPPPRIITYKGHVGGDPTSIVFIAVQPNGHIEGSVFEGDHILMIGRGVARGDGTRRSPKDDNTLDERSPLLVREFDPVEDLATNPDARRWHCDVDRAGFGGLHLGPPRNLEVVPNSLQAAPAANGTPTGYGLNLAIETDKELYAAFGSTPLLQSYLTTLIGQLSVIYQRDLKTTLTIGTVHIWSSGTDPWTVTTAADAALAEFGTYWHNNYSGIARSSAVFVSGKVLNAGISWGHTLCAADIYCGADGSNCNNGLPSSTFANSYAGAYAFCNSYPVVTTTVPDPILTQHGVQYGLPNTSNYRMLFEVAHELGHNANGQHTHCIPLSSAQQTQYGVVGRPYIDLCNGIENECYSGATSVPTERGTIMSYCANLQNPDGSSYPPSRYCFYRTGEPSELELGDTSAKCTDVMGSPSTCRFTQGLNDATPGLDATITVGSNLPCAAGQTASVPAGGSTYTWQITGGTITAGAGTNLITFTPSASGVTLMVTVANANGCSVQDSETVPTQCAPAIATINPERGSLAGSQGVTITGTNLSGATSVTFGGTAGMITANTALADTSLSGTTFSDCGAGIIPEGAGAELDWGSVAVTTSGWVNYINLSWSNGNSFTWAGITLRVKEGWVTVGNSDQNSAGINSKEYQTFPVSSAFYVIAGHTYEVLGEYSVNAYDSHAGCSQGLKAVFYNSGPSVTVTAPAHSAGAVDVVVSTVGGSATSTGGYTYVAATMITNISPASGPAVGGQSVMITGTDLFGAAVTIGGNSATVTGTTATTATFTTPAHAAGAVDVTVTTAGGSATSTGGYTYVASGSITSSYPTSGPAAGGQSVTITGTNLSGATLVTFGGNAGAITANTSTSITVTTPAHAAGAVDVTVTTAGGSVTSAGGYTYFAVLTLASVVPSYGSLAGGTQVAITGTGFRNGLKVSFGGSTVAASVTSVTTATAVTPAHVRSLTDVMVTNDDNASATKTTAFDFIYRGDANGDSQVLVGDIFYLVNNLFAGGPGPIGSGDANGDTFVSPGDIFYLVNYLFAGGPAPE